MTNPLVVVHKLRYHGDPEGQTYGLSLSIWCPGCKQIHRIQAVDRETGTGPKEGSTWEWNGATDETFTVSPSLLCHYSVHLCEGEHGAVVCPNPDSCGSSGHMILNDDGSPHLIGQPDPVNRVLGHAAPHTREPAWGSCHSFIQNGQWQFLSDCAHALAGKTVPMEPLPDWFCR